MYTQELAKEAKKFAGIKPDTIIDEEEKYYNRESVEKYEAFLAGANCAYNEFINKACEWLKNNFVNGKEIGCDAGAMHKNFKSIEEIIPSFIKAMEE